MKDKIKSKITAKQILTLLNEYGPISARLIAELIGVPESHESIQKTLKVLFAKGLIYRRRSEIDLYTCIFHQIHFRRRPREKVARIIGMPVDQLKSKEFTYVRLYNHESQIMWTLTLKKLFPEASIYRWHELRNNKALIDLVKRTRKTPLLTPDMIMQIPSGDPARPLSIAILNRYVRFDHSGRGKRGLRHFARVSQFDGVLSMCPATSIDFYTREVRTYRYYSKVPRIAHYWEQFWTFSSIIPKHEPMNLMLTNARDERVHITDWIANLKRIALKTPAIENFLRCTPPPKIDTPRDEQSFSQSDSITNENRPPHHAPLELVDLTLPTSLK